MTLNMKEACERCDRPLSHIDDAHICSYECTFCIGCSQEMEAICPNCGGELTARPKRRRVKKS